MDPGNWATDIAAGSQFEYQLLFIVLFSNIFAIFLQHTAIRLGIVTGLDLAEASKRYYPQKVNFVLWILAEIGIIAMDLAEVLGTAIALKLLFGIPLQWGVLITPSSTPTAQGWPSRAASGPTRRCASRHHGSEAR